MAKIIGIDDAGRGPVIGPMILAGVLIDENEEKFLGKWGAKDSKLLTSKKRKEIGDKITENFENHIEVTLPGEIDNSENLNYLEAIKVAMIINKLVKDHSSKIKVYVDCPSVNIDSWSEDVQKLIKSPEKIELVCEHKADLNHLVVSAASIIAKEKREEEIFKLRNEIGIDFGSGYPSDPKTKEFIKENFENEKYQKIIRFSWSTVKKLAKEKSQKQLF